MEGTDFFSSVMRCALAFASSWPCPAERSSWCRVEQLFQPLGVVLEAAADVDALQHLVVALMRLAQVGGHVVGIVEVGDRRREMRLARQQDVLGAAGQVGLVLLGERRNGKGVPAERVGVARIASSACRRRSRSRPDAAARRSAPYSRAAHRRVHSAALLMIMSAAQADPTGRYGSTLRR